MAVEAPTFAALPTSSPDCTKDTESMLPEVISTTAERRPRASLLGHPTVRKIGLASLLVGALLAVAWLAAARPHSLAKTSEDFEQKQIMETEPEATHEFLKLLRVCQPCQEPRRFGEPNDGGYLMCMDGLNPEKLQAAYSMGIGMRDGWSEEIVAEYNVPSYELDCTVDFHSNSCDNCHFHKKCVEAVNGKYNFFSKEKTWTLAEMFAATGQEHAEEGTLVVKVDIEGSEWPIFESEPIENLLKFQQIVVECHHLNNLKQHHYYATALKRVLDAGFSVAHVHGNNAGSFMKLGEAITPKTLEVTLVRTKGPQHCVAEQPDRDWDHRNIHAMGHLPRAQFV